MFDKLLYWKRRKKGERGQDPLPKPVLAKPRATPKPVTKKAVKKNTKRARKASK